jgi:hypothetical protein
LPLSSRRLGAIGELDADRLPSFLLTKFRYAWRRIPFSEGTHIGQCSAHKLVCGPTRRDILGRRNPSSRLRMLPLNIERSQRLKQQGSGMQKLQPQKLEKSSFFSF